MVAELPSRYGARTRRRSRGTVHSCGARREAAARENAKWPGPYTGIYQRGRERVTRLYSEVAALPMLPLPLPVLPWAGDAGSAVLVRRRGRPSMSGTPVLVTAFRRGFSTCTPCTRG